jgi:hypothetical protein
MNYPCSFVLFCGQPNILKFPANNKKIFLNVPKLWENNKVSY